MAMNLEDFNKTKMLYPKSIALVFGYIREKQHLLLPQSKNNIYYNVPSNIQRICALFYTKKEGWSKEYTGPNYEIFSNVLIEKQAI